MHGLARPVSYNSEEEASRLRVPNVDIETVLTHDVATPRAQRAPDGDAGHLAPPGPASLPCRSRTSRPAWRGSAGPSSRARGSRISKSTSSASSQNIIGPSRSLILARLEGGPLATTGVIAGMSGSPVYIDGRLIGAVSYSLGTVLARADRGDHPDRRDGGRHLVHRATPVDRAGARSSCPSRAPRSPRRSSACSTARLPSRAPPTT